MTHKLPLWQQACADPNKIPDRAIQLMQQMAVSSNGTVMPSPLSTSKSNLVISDPIPGAKPLPVPPELAPFVGVSIRGLYMWHGGELNASPFSKLLAGSVTESGILFIRDAPRRTKLFIMN